MENTRIPMGSIHVFAHPLRGGFVDQTIALKLCLKFRVCIVQSFFKTTTPAASADVPFLVKVSITDLNIRKGPGTDYARTQFISVGVYTIVEVKSGKGSTAGWGRPHEQARANERRGLDFARLYRPYIMKNI